MSSTLYIVATPIGNLADISLRAIEILKSVDCIAAEDTRHSKKLLSHHGVQTRLISYHEFGGEQQLEQLMQMLQQGSDIALISDAGTPLISDPGYRLVTAAHEANMTVRPIPGASALTAALSVCGIATDQFTFAGFLPAKSNARREKLSQYIEASPTAVFYEAPHRLLACLQDMLALYGPLRQVCLLRELTKTFETVALLPLADLIAWVEADSHQQRGEIVLVLSPVKAQAHQLDGALINLAQELSTHMPAKVVCKAIASHLKVSKKTLYDQLLSLKSD